MPKLHLDIHREALPKEEASALIQQVIDLNQNNQYQLGGLVDFRNSLPPQTELIFIGDLHGRLENLLKVLNANNNLEKLKEGKAILMSLGDGPHNEPRKNRMDEEEMARVENMESSVTIMQCIMELKVNFPNHFYYLLGNHDYLSVKYTKFGVMQGWVYRNHLKEVYGEEFIDHYRKFIATSPVLMVADGIVANHAGPCDDKFSLQDIAKKELAAFEDDLLVEQLEWRRWKHRDRDFAYNDSTVKKFLKNVIAQPNAVYLVGHSPYLLHDKKYHLNSFTAKLMKNHYMIFAAYDDVGYASFRHQASPESIEFINATSSSLSM